jgi:hypothetical protein
VLTLGRQAFFGFGVNATPKALIEKATKPTYKPSPTDIPALKVVPFPPPGVKYRAHSSEWLAMFKQLVDSHPEPNTLFAIAGPGEFPDQDWDYRQTGGWYRAAYEAAQPKRAKLLKPHELFDPKHVNIAVHIRRGDALRMHGAMKSDTYYVHIINRVVEIIRELSPKTIIKVHIFTDGSRGTDGKYEWKNLHYVNEKGERDSIVERITTCSECATLHIGNDALVSFHHLVVADVLISGSSMFSNFAGQIARNVHISAAGVRSYSHRGRIVANEASGEFSEDEFRSKWQAYVQCNRHQRRGWGRMRVPDSENQEL